MYVCGYPPSLKHPNLPAFLIAPDQSTTRSSLKDESLSTSYKYSIKSRMYGHTENFNFVPSLSSFYRYATGEGGGEILAKVECAEKIKEKNSKSLVVFFLLLMV